ncbi:MAG: NUDIX hydrolase [bacterium]|nr:NUDIX hydrolase [bacterium]
MEKKKKSEVVYDGRIIKVRRDEVVLDSGRESVREVVVHGGSVAMLPYDEKKKVFYLVRQYRYAVGKYVLEVPAGTLEKNEKIEDAVNRELSEEVGFVSDRIVKLASVMSSPGFLTEVLHLYLCAELRKKKMEADYDEEIEVVKMTAEEIDSHIKSDTIIDGKTVAAFLLWKDLDLKNG